jgi:hypothetical protein
MKTAERPLEPTEAEINISDRHNILTLTADDALLKRCGELSANAHHLPGFHFDDLPARGEALADVILEAVSVERVEHIAKPLAVDMHPVDEVGHVALNWLRLERELQNVCVGKPRDAGHFRDLDFTAEDVL